MRRLLRLHHLPHRGPLGGGVPLAGRGGGGRATGLGPAADPPFAPGLPGQGPRRRHRGDRESGMKAAAALLALLSVLGSVCALSRPARADVGPQSTFTFRLSGEPETLDWNKAHTPIETYLLMNL